jgi:heme-degrading monooxygenase HmoA
VDLEVSAGKEQGLSDTYVSVFRPAISQQPGFRSVTLLRPQEGSRWLLLIGFESEEDRLRWVATDLHQEVWPALAASCDRFEAVTSDAV